MTNHFNERKPGDRNLELETRTASRGAANNRELDPRRNQVPHDFRHRRASLWHGQGVPGAELAKRLGHSKPSMSLDVYSHVMPLDEAGTDAVEALLVMHR